MSANTFVQRAIDVTIKLGQGSYGTSGFDTVKLSGHRVVTSIHRSGPPGTSLADTRIYGMTESVMNQLSTLRLPAAYATRQNVVIIEAGDLGNPLSVVHQGVISNAWQNYDGFPETFFNIESFAFYFDAMRPVPGLSFNGVADVADLMAGIATQLSLGFENNGVNQQISYPHYSGTLIDQAQALAREADIGLFKDDASSTLAIWPKNGARGGAIPLISPDSGLIGYPRYASGGIQFRTLYNPNIRVAGHVQMKSAISPACGKWFVNEITHDLSAQVPDGPWFTDVSCNGYL